MIKDKLINSQTYVNISEKLSKGFDWLRNTDLKTLADGRYSILGEEVYANVQTYETKSEAKYESHRKYIDIQYMISGVENIGITDIANCDSCIVYDEDKDLEFFNTTVEEEFVKLAEGEFVVLFPQDAHKPSITYKEKRVVKKVVVKVLVD